MKTGQVIAVGVEGGTDKDSREYRSYTIASFARWARLYDPFLSLLGLKRMRRGRRWRWAACGRATGCWTCARALAT